MSLLLADPVKTRWRSALLEPYGDKLAYGFTGKPLPTGGDQLSEDQRLTNRRVWANAFTMPVEAPIVSLYQEHGTQLINATEALTPGLVGDAIVLDKPGTIGVIQVADCTPVLLYAPDQQVAVAIHAGWRGTARRIVPKAVEHLQAVYGVKPDRLKAVIGPSISLEAYEVGEEVVEALRASLEGEVEEAVFTAREYGAKPHVDVGQVNCLQLEAVGVTQVEWLAVCTHSNPEQLYSYRRGDWERQALLVSLL